MKRVSFKVAKALEQAGFPQEQADCVYVTKDIDNFDEGELIDRFYSTWAADNVVDAPFVLDVWLWLWREKKLIFDVIFDDVSSMQWTASHPETFKEFYANDPEDVVTALIEHLVDNNLIK